MSKRVAIPIVLVLVLVAGVFLLREFLPSEPKTAGPGSAEAQYVGISTETIGKLTETDRNNIFWTSDSGEGGVAFSTAPVYFPSLLRIGQGFAAPDRDAIIWVDQDLQNKKSFPVPGLDIGMQSTMSTSLDYSHGAFTFSKGDADFPDAKKVVAVTANEARSTDREHYVSALTACNNGVIKWIEFLPYDNKEVESRGTAQIVTWSPDGDIETSHIPREFLYAPPNENQLSCDSSSHTIVSEDDNGNPVSLRLESRGKETVVKDETELPDIPPPAMARFATVFDNTLYSLDKEDVLTAVDLKEGTLQYREPLDVTGPSPVSVTFEHDRAYVVVRPDEFENKQAVLPVDLEKPHCTGKIVPLIGYDENSQKSKFERLGDSFMVTTNALPKEPGRTPLCR